jgi:hypothetical protein
MCHHRGGVIKKWREVSVIEQALFSSFVNSDQLFIGVIFDVKNRRPKRGEASV